MEGNSKLHLFKKYGGLSFILQCNYDKLFLDQIDLHQLYKLLLLYFFKLIVSFPNPSSQEQIYSTAKVFQSMVILLLTATGLIAASTSCKIFSKQKFLSYLEFIQKYDLRRSFLFQVVSAIPRHPAESARVYPMDRSDMLLNSLFQLSPEISINYSENE